MNAEKSVAGRCPRCTTKVQVEVPDHRASLDAVRLWSDLGYGRPAQNPASKSAVSIDLERLKKLKHEEMLAEIEAMSNDELLTLCVLSDLETESAEAP
jgi:hypothetical protein